MPVAEAPVMKGRRKQRPKAVPKVQLLEGWEGCHDKFRENTYNFIVGKIVRAMADQRLARGVPPAETPEEAEEYDLDSTDGGLGASIFVMRFMIA